MKLEIGKKYRLNSWYDNVWIQALDIGDAEFWCVNQNGDKCSRKITENWFEYKEKDPWDKWEKACWAKDKKTGARNPIIFYPEREDKVTILLWDGAQSYSLQFLYNYYIPLDYKLDEIT